MKPRTCQTSKTSGASRYVSRVCAQLSQIERVEAQRKMRKSRKSVEAQPGGNYPKIEARKLKLRGVRDMAVEIKKHQQAYQQLRRSKGKQTSRKHGGGAEVDTTISESALVPERRTRHNYLSIRLQDNPQSQSNWMNRHSREKNTGPSSRATFESRVLSNERTDVIPENA